VPAEVLSVDELRKRWPQVEFEGMTCALYNPGHWFGLLRARRACAAVWRALERAGRQTSIGAARPGATSRGRLEAVRFEDGTQHVAETFVFACGPWLARVFPEVLGDAFAVERRDVFFVGTPAGDGRFDLSRLPTWSFAGDGGWYGFPSVDGRGLKACPTDERPPFDPDLGERVVGTEAVARARDYVGRRFPALRGQPILETRVCQVTNTANGYDFLVDRHPQLENVWLVGGGSGHGFKHGPALGEHIAKCVLGEPVDAELTARFRLQNMEPQ
jgi:sarcosine oxidase